MLITSIVSGAKIRTLWMTPFYLFLGILFVEFYKENLKKNLKKFLAIFLFFFILSPTAYTIISITNEFKRT